MRALLAVFCLAVDVMFVRVYEPSDPMPTGFRAIFSFLLHLPVATLYLSTLGQSMWKAVV